MDDKTAKASTPHPSDGAKLTPLFSEEEISARVQQLGQQIRNDFGDSEITLLCVLKGSLIFTSDLARAITGPVNIEFLGVRSYGDDTRSSGAVQITHDLTAPVEGRHVIVVEDIVDTGLTLKYLLQILSARRPASLRVCALLEKSSEATPVRPDYLGFRVGEGFVVGYGLDWAQRLRNLPYVAVVETPAEIEP